VLRNLLVLVVVILSAVVTSPAWAEKANMSPEDLAEAATHVVTGRVAAVYARTEAGEHYKDTHYVAEVRVDGVEKGEGIVKDGLVYVRYWTRAWIGKGSPPPGTGGHRGLPDAGDSLRIYLARNAYDGFGDDNKDGGFNVIGANGFEPLKPARGG
jgi:hypothetical protein